MCGGSLDRPRRLLSQGFETASRGEKIQLIPPQRRYALPEVMAFFSGVWLPIELCGRDSLSSRHHASRLDCASSRLTDQVALRHQPALAFLYVPLCATLHLPKIGLRQFRS